MKLGAYTVAAASIEQQKQLDLIANNIANSSTPGFKKDSVKFNNMLDQVSYTSFEQGPIRETGNKMDLALSGDGFLRVQTNNGILYTRAGNLTLDKSKTLVTQDGYPVLGTNNSPITINNARDLRVEENGQVFDGTLQAGTLDVVSFPSNQALKKTQGGYFEAPKDVAPAKAANCTVRQGSLESPNFSPVQEMVHMVETTRNFEAFQKMLQTFDRDLDGQLISRLSA